MAGLQLPCGNCRTWWSPVLSRETSLLGCPNCNAPTYIAVFPALTREETGGAAEATLTGTESTCFFHSTKVAERPCDQCGRFMCRLCDIDFEHRHLCPDCLEKSFAKGEVQQFDQEFTYYDTIALGFAGVSLLIFYTSIVLAPMAIFIAIRYWKKPLSMAPRGKGRYVIAIMLSLLSLTLFISMLSAALVFGI